MHAGDAYDKIKTRTSVGDSKKATYKAISSIANLII